MTDTMTRGERILDYIYDDVDRELNPSQEDCWHCGGEGYSFDCFDGCCLDAEIGCEECSREFVECKIYAGKRAKAIREEVIKTNDVEVAIAWLKSIDRWRDGITEEQVKTELAQALAKVADSSGVRASNASSPGGSAPSQRLPE